MNGRRGWRVSMALANPLSSFDADCAEETSKQVREVHAVSREIQKDRYSNHVDASAHQFGAKIGAAGPDFTRDPAGADRQECMI